MKTWTLYRVLTGEIIALFTGPDGSVEDQCRLEGSETTDCVEGNYPLEEYYFVGDTPTLRPANPATISGNTVTADGVDIITLSNIEKKSVITLHSPALEWDPAALYMPVYPEFGVPFTELEDSSNGAPVEITTDVIGEYFVTIKKWPFLDGGFVFNAVP